MSKILHISVDINGALKCAKDFVGCVYDDSGRALTDVEEIKAAFRQELALGHRLLPAAGCKNFDPQRGCLGCEKEDDGDDS
ncbi:MAG: hypothetical protein IJ561_02285 [Ruminococcus sp.]|nr:hypothetical protein [Ruminococcus sp.]